MTHVALKSAYYPNHDDDDDTGVILYKVEFNLETSEGKSAYNMDVAKILEILKG